MKKEENLRVLQTQMDFWNVRKTFHRRQVKQILDTFRWVGGKLSNFYLYFYQKLQIVSFVASLEIGYVKIVKKQFIR